MKCPKCRRQLVDPLGPLDAEYGFLVYEPFGSMPLDPKADHLLANELYRLGINSLEIRQVSLWGHAEGEDGEFPWHLKRAIKAMGTVRKIMLFGTDVTTVVLGEGISRIVGLVRPCAYFPDQIVMPVPNPAHVINKPLGEFRLCLEKLAKAKS